MHRPTKTAHETHEPLRRNAEYRRWLAGDVLLDAGAGIAAFAFPLVTLAVTGSVAAVGLVGLLEGIGGLAGMIPGGILADRFDRRRLRLLASATGILTQAVLVAVLVAGVASVPVLAGLAFVHRLRGMLLGFASDAMLKQIVQPAQLPRAISINQGRGAAIELGSAPASGALLAAHLALPALTLVIGHVGALLATLRMRGDYRPRPAESMAGVSRSHVGRDLLDALRWSIAQPVRVQLGAVAALVNLGSNGALLTVTLMLASRGIPAAQIGLLSSVLAASILVGAVLAPRIVERVPTGVIVIGGLVALAVLTLAIPFSASPWVIAVLYAVMGLPLPALNAACGGFFLHITPTSMQGRVGALNGLVAMGLMPLAPAIAGWGLAHAGAAVTLGVFAALCALAAVIGVVGPHLRTIPTAAGWAEHVRLTGLASDDPRTDGRVDDGAAADDGRAVGDGHAARG
ncbi:MFS transporter [Brachybacterium subflavum]|uniref:MFS transporter n=1 Tax=Brachybacterium subflavum TaxID=2585206 RepID=UPI0012667FB2|nr:MFS transporter [Brachybacterium subflavum]